MNQRSTHVLAAPAVSAELAPVDLNFGFDGTDGDQLVKPGPFHLRLQWFNGLSTTTFETAVGFHVEAGVHLQLDETLASMGVKRYLVQHKSPDQHGEVKQLPYWALNWQGCTCSLFVLAYGFKSKYEMNRNPGERYGIAYGWEVVRASNGMIVRKKGSDEPKRQCRLYFRAFVQELVAHGFAEWFQVSFSGHITEDVLAALLDHFRVVEVYNGYARTKDFGLAPFYGFSLPLVPGPLKMVGPKDGDKAPIYPPIAQIPPQITGVYLLTHRIPDTLQQRITDENLLIETTLWSIKRSEELAASGEERQEDTPPATPEVDAAPPAPPAAPIPFNAASPTVLDRPVTQEELNWMTRGYCMNNKKYMQRVCTRFQVETLAQLRKQHYDLLLQESADYSQPIQ